MPTEPREDFNNAAFTMELRPHRSLSRKFQAAVIGLTTVSSLGAGAIFTYAGAWPVALFLIIPPLGMAMGIRAVNKSGREYQLLTLDQRGLTVDHFMPARGETFSRHFQPPWTGVRLSGEEGSEKIHLITKGRDYEIGAFLPPGEKRDVADRLRSAMQEWTRHGIVRHTRPGGPDRQP